MSLGEVKWLSQSHTVAGLGWVPSPGCYTHWCPNWWLETLGFPTFHDDVMTQSSKECSWSSWINVKYTVGKNGGGSYYILLPLLMSLFRKNIPKLWNDGYQPWSLILKSSPESKIIEILPLYPLTQGKVLESDFSSTEKSDNRERKMKTLSHCVWSERSKNDCWLYKLNGTCIECSKVMYCKWDRIWPKIKIFKTL